MLSEFIGNINRRRGFKGIFRFDEPMAAHTTFKVGGPADLWIRPGSGEFPEYAALLLGEARREGIPVFILGGGANLVVSDRGIRGIVLDTGGYAGFREPPSSSSFLEFRPGTAVDDAVEAAAAAGLSGLEFLAGMPGSIGGALWMNARCYERSVSGVLIEAEYLDLETGRRERLTASGCRSETGETLQPSQRRREAPGLPGSLGSLALIEGFGYKKSPFQDKNTLILGGRFAVHPRPVGEIRAEMAEHRRDREEKGHYRYPSAGSVFKNNRLFGMPTGKLIDNLGLRGLAVGDAQVAPWHGNIIINRGKASAGDIRNLVDLLITKVKDALGLDLETEVLFSGEWGEP
jgi:UDP-N-acetylmuramate dehydrogenase